VKLLRYGVVGREKPGAFAHDGTVRDLSDVIRDVAGGSLLPEAIEQLRKIEIGKLPRVNEPRRFGPCVGSVGKFICIGLNYSDHAAESGMAVPHEPIVFMKATSAICGPNDDVAISRGSEKTD
jgi:2-keto-4-pentenoate hydratase/2-oxohepta-3-ene-1,7-dioic acid hydratase in catechol pathway